jgi:hypothetical protein
MKVTSSVFACALLSGIVIACGGSSSSIEDGPATDQTLEAIAGSFCDRLAACYGDFFVKAFIGDTTTCKSRLAIELKASTRGPGAQVQDAAAKTCKTAVDAAACNLFLSDGVPECDFRGTLADGAACASDSQCLSGACFVDAKTDCGKCGLRAAEGADCTSAKCTRGLTCTDAKKCVKRAAEGGACDSSSACEPSLSCIKGKCGKGLAKGAACKNGAMETPCDTLTGLYCKPPSATAADGSCTPFTTAQAGQACGVTLQPTIDYAFCEKSQCVGASGTAKGTCQVFLADGATCNASTQPDCQFPAKCRNGKCATLDPTVCK